MKKLLVTMLLLYPLSALCATYQWTDARGTVNFAEDLGKVPKKYRKKAKTIGDYDAGAPQVSEVTETVQGKEKEKDQGEERQKGKKLYGGRDEESWRREFQAARFDLRQAESELTELRGRIADSSKMSRNEYLTIQLSIKDREARLKQRQKKLELLQESAKRAEVPKELRE